MITQPATFEQMWSAIADLGRDPITGGYRRFAWTPADLSMREWFSGECAARGLDLTEDRMGNQWAWWGDPDSSSSGGVATGSHLDSVPDGGAFDGPLGVVSALAAIDRLRADGFLPHRPIGVVNFVDEEGARFGVSCAGSRMITGVLSPDRARALRDASGITMAEAMRLAGRQPDQLGPDPEALARVGSFIELHIEQGRGLIDLGQALAVGSGLWPHGRWRIDVPGEANHAGTTRLSDRRDAVIGCARAVLVARAAAEAHGSLATVGKINIQPGGVNAIASSVTAWLDARAADEAGTSRDRCSDRAGGRQLRCCRHRGVVDSTDRLRRCLGRPPGKRAGRCTGDEHRGGPRCWNSGECGRARGDDLRPQPHRRVSHAGRVGRAGRLPGWCCCFGCGVG